MNDEKNKPEPIQELIDKWNKMPRLSKSQPPATEKPSALPKCESGCKVFTGGEIKHNEECVFYPESLTKLNADIIATQQLEIERLKAELKYRFVRFEEEQSKAESLKAELDEVRGALRSTSVMLNFHDLDTDEEIQLAENEKLLSCAKVTNQPTPNPNGHE